MAKKKYFFFAATLKNVTYVCRQKTPKNVCHVYIKSEVCYGFAV